MRPEWETGLLDARGVLDALKAKGLDVRPDDLMDLRKDRR
jgi:hypothetical protein